MKDKTLVVSFSGGRTSAYMTKLLLSERDNWKDIVVIFANTGQEDERTLEFVHNCDVSFGFNTVWVESVTHPERGKGTTHKIVTYDTASRDGKPFEEMIAKYGIPFTKAPHCTRNLKQYPIQSYLRSLGLKRKDYRMAIGIRADEFDRISSNAEANSLIYPLVDEQVTKQNVLDWWRGQPFDLDIPEHYGNCTWCWKKSFKKLMTLMQERPEVFEFPERMEALHGRTGAVPNKIGKDVKFFRGFKSVQDIRDMAAAGFDAFEDKHYLEITNGCEDSCEINFEQLALEMEK
jgi:hypothetical protein